MGHSRQERIFEEQAALALLESADMRAPLEQAMHSLGARLSAWKLLQLHHRPGAGASAIYEISFEDSDGSAAVDYLCATTADVGEPATPVLRLHPSAGGVPALTVWRHPLDPLLPGLAWACDSGTVATEIFGQRCDGAQLSTVSYRPLRRAVIRAVLNDETAYLKVVRRGHGAPLWQRHQLLAAAGLPVPAPYRKPVRDVVALREVTGTPLANELLANGARELDAATLLALLRRIPPETMELPERPAWAMRAADYAQAAAAALPQERERIMDVAAKIVGLLPSTDPGPLVPTHGDFYEANLLVDGGEITGLLDVDAVGPGRLVDDLACFIGHLAVLPAVDSRYELVPAAMNRFLDSFDIEVDPAGLRIRAAGVALSLIAGAKRSDNDKWRADALGRLKATEQLADAAVGLAGRGLPESFLIQHSSTPHIQPAI